MQINHIELAKEYMTREKIDQIWQKSLHDSVKDGEQFTRYHFADAVIEQVEKELRSNFVGIADVIDVVRDMKVKG